MNNPPILAVELGDTVCLSLAADPELSGHTAKVLLIRGEGPTAQVTVSQPLLPDRYIYQADELRVFPRVQYSDSQRLEFLLRFIRIEDVGDDTTVPGVAVQGEEMAEHLSFGSHHGAIPSIGITTAFQPPLVRLGDNIRRIIDRAMESYQVKWPIPLDVNPLPSIWTDWMLSPRSPLKISPRTGSLNLKRSISLPNFRGRFGIIAHSGRSLLLPLLRFRQSLRSVILPVPLRFLKGSSLYPPLRGGYSLNHSERIRYPIGLRPQVLA